MSGRSRGSIPPGGTRKASFVEYAATTQVTIAGPLPPPHVLAQYDRIVPGAAKLFVESYQAQSKHRREIELAVIRSNIEREKWGQIFALVVTVMFCASGTCVILEGHPVAGATVIGANLLGLVTAFLFGARRRDAQLSEKRPLPAPRPTRPPTGP